MPVLINLKSYLANLERNEMAKPESERQSIPTLTELADIAGIHRVPFTRIANGRIKLLNLEVVDSVIEEMRRRGFNMDITDFIVYQPRATKFDQDQ